MRELTADEQGIVRKPAVPGRKYIACDLDGTLAFYDKHISRTHIGDPIPLMVAWAKRKIEEGHIVIIFTSRVADVTKDNAEVYAAIHAWTEKWLGERLYVTATKWPYFSEMYDDRAYNVARNTGVMA